MNEDWELLDIEVERYNETKKMWGFIPWTNKLEFSLRFFAIITVIFIVVMCIAFATGAP